MIEQTLQFIKTILVDDPTLDLDASEVTATNFHTLQADNSKGLYYSLVNIEEESTLKNRPNYIRQNNQLQRIEPPVILNLYILFAFLSDGYNISIQNLSRLVSFFQTNRWFSLDDNLSATQLFDPPVERIVFELYHLNFEQINHLWSILGGNHYPSVLYKVRVVKVQRDQRVDAPEITSISLESGVSN